MATRRCAGVTATGRRCRRKVAHGKTVCGVCTPPTPAAAACAPPAASAHDVSLCDLVNQRLLDSCVAGKLVKVNERNGLRIYNYRPKAVYSGNWNDATLLCRGLVTDTDGKVLARPFKKFFGLAEPHAPPVPADAPMHVTEKLDGSLGIAFAHNGRVRIATRGSFDSPQAQHAEQVWRDRYSDVSLPANATPLFEVIYPENRVVVDYKTRDDLTLLAVIDHKTGADLPLDCFGWPGPKVRTAEFGSFDELAAYVAGYTDSRNPLEGFVARFDTGGNAPHVRIKLKTADYVNLHRIRFGLNARVVWKLLLVDDALARNADLRVWAARLRVNPEEVTVYQNEAPGLIDRYKMNIPEEFWPWYDKTAADLRREADNLSALYQTIFERSSAAAAAASPGARRRVYSQTAIALAEASGVTPGPAFALLDSKPDVRAGMWAQVRPAAGISPDMWPETGTR